MDGFGLRVMTAHATEIAATPEPLAYARAALILWVNQAGTAQGGLPGVSVALVAALLAWVNDDAATPPRLDSMESTDPGFGALVMNCQLALHVLAERQMPCREGECLPLMSHNNLLLGRLAFVCLELERLASVGAATAALSLAAFEGNTAVFEDACRWEAASRFDAAAAAAIASWTRADIRWTPRRMQDPLDLRCAATALGALLRALQALESHLRPSYQLHHTGDCF